MTTGIEWTDETWNPVTGCSKVSEGCRHCYAERVSHRFGWTESSWTARNVVQNVQLHPERLSQPLQWRKPRRIFVNSMSDLFHEQVTDEFIAAVFAVMAEANWHTFQILTKRPQRMLEVVNSLAFDFDGAVFNGHRVTWPLPNVWLGVSVENQRAADERIPLLLQTPAAVRFLSCEPLLGPVDLTAIPAIDGMNTSVLAPECWGDCACDKAFGFDKGCKRHGGDGQLTRRIDWVIAGGESGPSARPMHPDWARSLRDQCQETAVPFLFKQWGGWAAIDEPWQQKSVADLKSNEQWLNYEGGSGFHGDSVWRMRRVGKKKAGRMLDGQTWNEMPEVTEQ